MQPVSLYGYGMNNAPSLATYFNAANQKMNKRRMSLAEAAMAMKQKQAEAAQKAAAAKQSGLAAAFGGQQPVQQPVQNPDYGVPGMDAPGMPQSYASTEQQPVMGQDFRQTAAILAKSGFNIDEIKQFHQVTNMGRDDAIKMLTDMGAAQAQAAQSIMQLPEEQRADAWMQATTQLEQTYGVDIPDAMQQYSPENLEAAWMRGVGVNEAFKAKQPTTAVQNALYATGGDEGAARKLVRTGIEKPATQVNLGGEMSMEDRLELIRAEKQAEAQGKADIGTLERLQEESGRMREQAQILRQMRGILPATNTGALGESALQVQKIADRFGITLDVSGETTSAELFQKLSNQLTLLQRRPGEGEMSDSDRAFYQEAVPNLTTSPDGNAVAIDFALKRAERAMQLEELYEDWLRTPQNVRDTWSKTRNRYVKENPLYTETDRERAKAVLGQGKSAKTSKTVEGYIEEYRALDPAKLLEMNPEDMTLEQLRAYNKVIAGGQ